MNLQLDEWVLCRIYNKKGCIEKHYQSTDDFEEEDEKPNISATMPNNNNMVQMDTSYSVPLMHTDSSSGSDPATSPEVTWDKEVQSRPKSGGGGDIDFFEFSYIDSFSAEDNPFGTQVQFQMDNLSPLQDTFSYLPWQI